MSDYIRIDENTPVPPTPQPIPRPAPQGPPMMGPPILLPPGMPPFMYAYPPPPPQQPAPQRGGFFMRMLGGMAASIVMALIMMFLWNFMIFGGGGGSNKVREDSYRAGDNRNRIALIPVDGLIDFSSSDRLRVMLDQAESDATVKAVVLWVNSPGGYVASSDEMFRHVQKFRSKAGKPVIVQMRGVAASGGYYVAAASDYIFAEPSTVTGSIGVVMQWYGMEGFLKDHNIDSKVFRSGDRKYRGGMFEKLDEKTVKEIEELLAYDHKLFVDAVFEGRKNLPRDKIEAAATGQAYHAGDALKLQLIDKIGYLDDALSHAAGAAGLTGPAVVQYKPAAVGLFDLFGAGARAAERIETFDAAKAVNSLIPRRMYLAMVE